MKKLYNAGKVVQKEPITRRKIQMTVKFVFICTYMCVFVCVNVRFLYIIIPLQMEQDAGLNPLNAKVAIIQKFIIDKKISFVILITLQCLMFSKRSHTLKQTCSFQMQVCLSMCDHLVDIRHSRDKLAKFHYQKAITFQDIQ